VTLTSRAFHNDQLALFYEEDRGETISKFWGKMRF
jgi:hypothetical protein